jgi:biotin carboxyl carrier protein
MPGTLLAYKVGLGDVVRKGQVVAVLEAMKMQNELQSPVDGKVVELRAREGAILEGQAVILVIEPGAA